MAIAEPTPPDLDEPVRSAAVATLRQAQLSAQLAPPSDDPDSAVQALWITLESLVVDHVLPPAPDQRVREPVPVATGWKRLATVAVTHAFVLGGTFLTGAEVMAVVEESSVRYTSGRLWHTRRPPGQGALVLAVHAAVLRLDEAASAGRAPGAAEAGALIELVGLAVLGAALAEVDPVDDRGADHEPDSGSARRPDPARMAAAFGIPEIDLVAVTRDGWVCDECGCVFVGRVEAGIAYPDRLAPVGRRGPCDLTTECACHAAPVQRRVR